MKMVTIAGLLVKCAAATAAAGVALHVDKTAQVSSLRCDAVG